MKKDNITMSRKELRRLPIIHKTMDKRLTQAKAAEMLDLFASPQAQERRRKLADTIDKIEDRFGHGKILPAKVLRTRVERDR